jgi:GNAT superfamily N-acetyltransferase
MSVEFQRVDPQSVRDEVVNFFRRYGGWPAETLEDYYRVWDWRYSALSEGPPGAYIARLKSTGELVGHIGAYRRNFRCGDATISVCVPGNLLVHPDWQQNIVGVRLLMFLRTLVRSREFDAVLGFGNKVANGMLQRLGFTQLGAMHTYVDIRDSGPLLRRRRRAFAVAAPFVNLGVSIRRLWSERVTNPYRHSDLRVSRLAAADFLGLDRSHWAPPDRFVACESNRFVVDRYLNEPQTERHLYGLFDPATHSLEAYVVTEPTARIKVWDCQTNPATIDPPAAIAAVVASWQNPETVMVPTLPQSDLAKDFARHGFFHRELVDSTEARTFLSAYSLPDNPHAQILNDPARWNIWLGSRHY